MMDAAGSTREMRFWGGDGAPEAVMASVLWGGHLEPTLCPRCHCLLSHQKIRGDSPSLNAQNHSRKAFWEESNAKYCSHLK